MIQTAFNSGEITPLLHGRPEVGVYSTGCARMLNMRALIHGGATRDPGLEHLGIVTAGTRARLIPFEFSVTQRFQFEFTDEALRVWSTGGGPSVVATLVTPYTTDELRAVQYHQRNDVVIFTHASHPPQQLTRTGADAFTWSEFAFTDPPFRDQNSDPDHTLTLTLPNVAGSAAWVTATPYTAGQGASYSGVDYLCTKNHTSSAGTRPDVGATYNSYKYEVGADGRVVTRLVKLPYWQVEPAQPIAPTGSLVTMTSSLAIFDAAYIGEEFSFAFRRSLTERRTRKAIPATSTAVSDAIEVDGAFSVVTTGNWTGTIVIEQSDDLGLTWTDILIYEAAANANYNETHETASSVLIRASITTTAGIANSPTVTLTASDPFSRAVVRVTSVSSSTVATVLALSPLKQELAAFWSYAAFSKRMGFPTAVAFHRQRLWFAGTAAEPQKLWASAIDQYDIFRRRELADESADEDQSFAVTPTGGANRIGFLSSQKELVAGTAGSVTIIAGDQQNGRLGPASYQEIPLAHFGAETLQPLDADIGIIMLQRGGRVVRHIGALTDIVYSTPELEELSLFGEHLTQSGIVEHAYQRSPQPIYWAVTADGRLIGHTHKPDQRVLAWHDHDLGDRVTVESVSVCYSDTAEDQVWLALAHYDPEAETTVRTLERFALGQAEAQESESYGEFRYLHHFQSFDAAAEDVLNFTTFGHLAGRTLSVYIDGQIADTLTASADIDYTAPYDGTYVIGCPYESTIETLPPVTQTQRGPQGFLTVTKIGRCLVLLHKSGPGTLQTHPETPPAAIDVRPLDTPLEDLPPLKSDSVQVDGLGGYGTRSTVTISTSEPYPFTVLAINYALTTDESL